MTTKYTKWLKNVINGRKLYQRFPFQGPKNYTKFGICGMKIFHLANLLISLPQAYIAMPLFATKTHFLRICWKTQ
jgi:hypothetical protein